MKYYKKVLATKARNDKIYYSLLKDKTRDRILDRTIIAEECLINKMYQFLALLQKTWRKYEDIKSFSPILINE